jgi:hypothetical protein
MFNDVVKANSQGKLMWISFTHKIYCWVLRISTTANITDTTYVYIKNFRILHKDLGENLGQILRLCLKDNIRE